MEEIHSRTTKDRFYLTLKVITKRIGYKDLQSRGKTSIEEADAVLLIPEQTTESDLFFHAWLPPLITEEEKKQTHGIKDYAEVVIEMGDPVYGYFRGALCHANNRIDRPHIFVMTKMAEEKLKMVEGSKVKATIIGEDEEEVVYGDLRPETKSPYADLQ